MCLFMFAFAEILRFFWRVDDSRSDSCTGFHDGYQQRMCLCFPQRRTVYLQCLEWDRKKFWLVRHSEFEYKIFIGEQNSHCILEFIMFLVLLMKLFSVATACATLTEFLLRRNWKKNKQKKSADNNLIHQLKEHLNGYTRTHIHTIRHIGNCKQAP